MTKKATMIHGDFFEEYLKLEQESFDLILSDPPYNRLQQAGQSWDTKKINWITTESILSGLIKLTGWIILFCDFLLAVELTNTFQNELEFHGIHIWSKPGGTPAGDKHALHNTEHILLFRKKGVRVNELPFNPKSVLPTRSPYTKVNRTQSFSTRRQIKSEVNVNTTGDRWIKTEIPDLPIILPGPSKPNMKKSERLDLTHPTIKPQAVLQPLIKCYSNPGAKILDPFGGSFSTVLAAMLVGGQREATGIELNQIFYDEGKRRIENALQQQNLDL